MGGSNGASGQTDSSSPQFTRKRSLPIVVVVIVVIVVAASAMGVAVYEYRHGGVTGQANLHVAILSLSKVESITGSNMTETSLNVALPGNYTVIQGMQEEFNKSANNTAASIIITSVEFSSSTKASNFYAYAYESIMNAISNSTNVTKENSSFDGFSYFVIGITFTSVNSSVTVAIGQSGQYLFDVVNTGVPVPYTSTLIDAEIKAM